MVVLQLSQDVLAVMEALQLSRDVLLVMVVLQLSQDLLVEHMMVHQQPSSAFEADRVQHALADLWERAGRGRLDMVED